MELVSTVTKDIEDYRVFMDTPTSRKVEELTRCLRGRKFAMVNATEYGGGVAEILHSLVPLLKSLGLHIDWWKMYGEDDFFYVTKAFHNCLQGEGGTLSGQCAEVYRYYNQFNARQVGEWDYDVVVIHDPQPAALVEAREDIPGSRWVWRCHIDTSSPNQDYWDFLYQYIRKYDAAIFTMEDFVKEGLDFPNLFFFTPTIDPLSPKNMALDKEEARAIVSRFGVDINRPLVSQVSRFDPWKDPLGVIEAYKIVRKEFPSVQLALVGSMASDDPEGWDYLYRTLRRAGEDYDIKVITNFNGISHREVNAFQAASDIIIQKSLREGFGLTVTEGMWKGTPVVGGNTGGIRLQIEDGVTGYLVDTAEECAEKVLKVLRNPVLAEEMTRAGREKVRRQFLVTRAILNYLDLFHYLLKN